ncbi:2-hydroxy-acid oxidase [Pseudolabrys sp. Root1462]|uniref:glycolate oxidase subunit GlcE n=1 Tax=Pseudolabrys sp. Root1462 TaxID=1736466 RepID=UPI0007029C2E|nr:glycolate oxidase subunit GlcE [Pseudolabrys sp. Root1462]KQY99879.1 2-hydroxy-acid oxidase [Pseudolabrys sp. Root1462]
MTDVLKPADIHQAEEAVRWAVGNDKTLELVGSGSKRALGRPSQTDITLDLSSFTGVTLYEPDELILSARAGTPLAEIEKLLDDNNQQLDFEPMDYGPLLGQPAGQGTIGGVLATNLAGPRRIKAGAARDHFLGVTAVTGRGEAIKSGGRVVKNVTGYDMCKVLAGSWGTLAAMTDVTIKVLPKPETEATVVVEGLNDGQACAAMAAALGSSCDVSAAAHLPDHVASYFDGLLKAEAATVLRLEGVAPSVAHRTGMLAKLLQSFGYVVTLDAAGSQKLWRSVRQVAPFAADSALARPLWRISTPPAQAHRLVDLITPAAQMFYDWGGGLVWVAMPFEGEADAGSIRRAVVELGGHATLVRAPAALRASLDVFQPQEPGLAALSKRVKESFDPKAVLNPGRMWAGV